MNEQQIKDTVALLDCRAKTLSHWFIAEGLWLSCLLIAWAIRLYIGGDLASDIVLGICGLCVFSSQHYRHRALRSLAKDWVTLFSIVRK